MGKWHGNGVEELQKDEKRGKQGESFHFFGLDVYCKSAVKVKGGSHIMCHINQCEFKLFLYL